MKSKPFLSEIEQSEGLKHSLCEELCLRLGAINQKN